MEFQTPTYERLIAMFAQKVVTQSHWDTEQALARMHPAPYTPPATAPLEAAEEGVTLDRIVDFPQFQVVRARLAPGAARVERAEGIPSYRLLAVTEGSARLKLPGGAQRTIKSGQACLVPAALETLTVAATRKEPLTYLTAQPVMGGVK
jgi:mannose-6-phosphate isomerase class I